VAEAGINNAASILSKSNAYDPHALHPQGALGAPGNPNTSGVPEAPSYGTG